MNEKLQQSKSMFADPACGGRIRNKLEGIRYFLVRPQLWGEMVRRRLRNIRLRLRIGDSWRHACQGERNDASHWCQERAIDTEDALDMLDVDAALRAPLSVTFPQIMAEAKAIVGDRGPDESQGGNIYLLHALCEHIQARRVVETGVAFGWSSLALLLSLKNRPDARLESTDFPEWKRRFDSTTGSVVRASLRSQWTLHRCADREALPDILRRFQVIDLAHYDSDKTYEGRLWGYPRLWRALRPGGVLLSDDVSDNFGFRDFCDAVQQEPVIIRHAEKYQGLLIKPA